MVDILVVNGVEAEMLGAEPVGDVDSALAAARSLLSLAPAVVVTAGEAGVAAATAEGTVRIEAHQVGPAETHGAGDVFVGALGARLALGDSQAEALRYANAAAALHVSTPLSEREALGPAAVEALLQGRPRGPSRRLRATLSCAPADQSGSAAPRPRRRFRRRHRRPHRPAKARAADP